MPAFTFEALDAQGQTRKGTLEADNARAARSQLRSQALVPLQVEPVAAGKGQDRTGASGWFTRPVFNSTSLAVWTRQLSGLVSSGLPIERALAALSEEAEDERQHQLVAALRAEVNAGSSFARALEQHPREFSDIFCAVIGAGESSGSLGPVLENLADDLEARQALQSKLIGASLYPAIVTLVAIVIVIFLVSYVVPQVAGVFAGTKRALPFLTVVMLGISDFVRHYGWFMLAVLLLAAVGFRLALRNEAFRERFDAQWLRALDPGLLDQLDTLLGRLSRAYEMQGFLFGGLASGAKWNGKTAPEPGDGYGRSVRAYHGSTLAPVCQIDRKTNQVIHEYPSIAAAARATGLDDSAIGKVCKGKLPHAGGFLFRYIEQ